VPVVASCVALPLSIAAEAADLDAAELVELLAPVRGVTVDDEIVLVDVELLAAVRDAFFDAPGSAMPVSALQRGQRGSRLIPGGRSAVATVGRVPAALHPDRVAR